MRDAFRRAIAIVGSRSSTAYGEHVAATLSAGVADAGWTVVSGGAYGIDARVHRAALAADGATVAVMAGGVDRLYPLGNADLLARVLETGAIVAEQPPGFPPHRSRFLTRNRIIAAAAATVVVEAAHRSGALSTAHHAAELGRPVGAVPGPVTSASSAGCHRLIRNGAVCVTSPDDVLEMVTPLDASRPDSTGPRPRTRTRDFATGGERAAYDAIAGAWLDDTGNRARGGTDADRGAVRSRSARARGERPPHGRPVDEEALGPLICAARLSAQKAKYQGKHPADPCIQSGRCYRRG